MPSTIDCKPSCCTTPSPVNIPGLPGDPGTPGDPGAAGTNGKNAFTTTSANFNVPAAAGGAVTVSLVDTAWMVAGQTIVIAGPATFTVTSIGSSTDATLAWVQGSNDVAANTLIASGAGVSPSGPKPVLDAPTTSYGAGAPQSLTNAFAQILSVGVTLAKAGTYLLFGRARLDLNAATITNQTTTVKVRRTNNTAADIANATTTRVLEPITTKTWTIGNLVVPIAVYTATAGDTLQLMATLSAATGAGSVDCNEAELIAVKIS